MMEEQEEETEEEGYAKLLLYTKNFIYDQMHYSMALKY